MIKTVSIIVSTKDRVSVLLKTLVSIKKSVSDFPTLTFELIVINDSTKDLILPDTLNQEFTIYKNHKSGVASARNYGVSKSTGELLIFIDDDIIITPESITKTINFFEQNNVDVALNLNWKYPNELISEIQKHAFGRYLIHYGFTCLEGRGWANRIFTNRNNYQEIELASSCYLAILKDTFAKVQGYTETFKYAGAEDYDFASKLKNNHIKTYILPNCYVLHNEEDRVNIKEWMDRKIRSGYTRKQAVNIGHKHLTIQYSVPKKILYKILIVLKPLLYSLLNSVSALKSMDFISFRIINGLLAISIFEGYTQLDEKN